MRKVFGIVGAAVLAAGILFSGKASVIRASGESRVPDTAQDMRMLRDYLLAKPADADLTGIAFDRSGDEKWDATDLSIVKQDLLHETTTKTQSDTLVAYFSRTGNTEKIAQYIIELTGADSYEIEAAVPYSDADIRYQDDSCRANQEQNDKSVRPEIAQMPESLDGYDVIYLGYPIWWGEEPRIIDTFLEKYDFSQKTVIPFCTSGSSGIASSEKNIGALVPIGNQLAGRRFPASASKDSVKSWLDTLPVPEKKGEQRMQIEVNGKTLTAKLADTQAAKELAEKLKAAPVTVKLDEYGGFEKVGALPWALTKSDEQTVTEAGDIMLYQGDKMTVFYASNSWSYTKLGHIEDATAEKLAELFGDGDLIVTLSLTAG